MDYRGVTRLLNINTMEPSEALSTAAQIAVALAGFAGVVVVFRRESVHDWSAIDKFRLRLLLTNSILPLALCGIGVLLLTVKPAHAGIWRGAGTKPFGVLHRHRCAPASRYVSVCTNHSIAA